MKPSFPPSSENVVFGEGIFHCTVQNLQEITLINILPSFGEVFCCMLEWTEEYHIKTLKQVCCMWG
jgi:hypothetical protein